MGTEFIPSLDEGDIALHAMRIPGYEPFPGAGDAVSLERRIKEFPEVAGLTKMGTAEIATDPMPPSVADSYVMLKERDDWPEPGRPTKNWFGRSQRPWKRSREIIMNSPSPSRCASMNLSPASAPT